MKCSVAFHLRFRKKLKIITKFQINLTRGLLAKTICIISALLGPQKIVETFFFLTSNICFGRVSTFLLRFYTDDRTTKKVDSLLKREESNRKIEDKIKLRQIIMSDFVSSNPLGGLSEISQQRLFDRIRIVYTRRSKFIASDIT